MKRQGYGAAEIAEVIDKGNFIIPDKPLIEPTPPQTDDAMTYSDYFDSISDIPEDTSIIDSLTDEDKLYLRMKWGKAYKPDEWV